jgi:hypothetical protein
MLHFGTRTFLSGGFCSAEEALLQEFPAYSSLTVMRSRVAALLLLRSILALFEQHRQHRICLQIPQFL